MTRPANDTLVRFASYWHCGRCAISARLQSRRLSHALGGVFVDRDEVTMVSIAIILLIIGVVIVVVSAVTPIPPPIGTLGWVALAIGVILLVLGLLLPALPVHYGATHVMATQA